MSALLVLLCAAAVAILLVADARGRRVLAGGAKVVASCAFVAFALVRGVLAQPDAALVLGALVFCWLGDVFLIGRARAAFLLGLTAFLLGHVLFAVAFAGRGWDPLALALGVVGYAVFSAAALRWLSPHVEGGMVWPVRAYVVVISIMGALAMGATAALGDPRLAGGAFAFAVSDLFVAREQFVERARSNRRIGLPLYYGSVLLLAWALT